MIRQHREFITAVVTTRRTQGARHMRVALSLDSLQYLLTADEARRLADQLHDRAEEIQ